MPYLGIDTDRAAGLVVVLQQCAAGVDPIVHDLHTAETMAGLSVSVDGLLMQIEAGYRLSATQVMSAAAELVAFRLQLSTWQAPPAELVPTPVRTPVPVPDPIPAPSRPEVFRQPRWNATPNMAWDRVMQDASHNSYEVPGGIQALYRHGLRTFELDIHRGAPTDLVRPHSGSWLHRFTETAADHFDHGGGRSDDWRVYHVSGSADSEYDYLSDGLAVVAALNATDPLTVFIDNKDAFDGTHTGEQLDAVLEAELGDRLFKPSDLMARAPGAATLQAAVELAGWPTVAELRGRVLVVVTDQIDDYHGATGLRPGSQSEAAAFVAPAPRFANSPGSTSHVPLPHAVFYNADEQTVDALAVGAVAATNSLLRTYFNPRCAGTLIDEQGVGPNYRAVDAMPGEPECSPPGPRPPKGTPVPE